MLGDYINTMKITFNFILIYIKLTSGVISGSLGEGQIAPPPLFSYCDTNLLHLIGFWKALGLYLNILQKMANLQKSKYLLQNRDIKQKCPKQKLCKLQQLYIF